MPGIAGVGVHDPYHGVHDARPLPGSVTVLLAHSPEYWEAEGRYRRRASKWRRGNEGRSQSRAAPGCATVSRCFDAAAARRAS